MNQNISGVLYLKILPIFPCQNVLKGILISVLHSSPTQMQKLTFCLLYEIGEGSNSWWFPYFKHLPQSYDILPTFGEFEKQALQVRSSLCVILFSLPFVSFLLISLDYIHIRESYSIRCFYLCFFFLLRYLIIKQ